MPADIVEGTSGTHRYLNVHASANYGSTIVMKLGQFVMGCVNMVFLGNI